MCQYFTKMATATTERTAKSLHDAWGQSQKSKHSGLADEVLP